MSISNTQLTLATGYDVSNMVFSEPVLGIIPESKPEIKYKRIMLSTRNPDGTIGELIMPTEKCFSYGISESLSQETGVINGYSFPICLYTRDHATEKEKQWVNTFNNIVEHCKTHLLNKKSEIEKYDLELNDLKKLNPLYWKRDRGKVVENVGPTLYTKLMMKKKEISTMFYDQSKNEALDPMNLIGKHCMVEGAVKFESIFVGANKISMQIKLYEAEVTVIETGMKRLLQRKNPVSHVGAPPPPPTPQPPSIVVQKKESESDEFESGEKEEEILSPPPEEPQAAPSVDLSPAAPEPVPKGKKVLPKKILKK
jgi:hypothetical protein